MGEVMIYEKKLWLGFIPYWTKLTYCEARAKVETLEVLEAFKDGNRLSSCFEQQYIEDCECDGHVYPFVVGGRDGN